ncbi:MAG: F0F1 ATP synthase subunit B [Sinomicrobium sp.]|nr:F0F1 ATP synthase subunit B [Sinomicrobium sp.]
MLTPELGLVVWTTLSFLVLLFILTKYAWKPIINALNQREEGIKKALESAEEARKEIQHLQADNEKLLAQARVERDAMLKEAREIKDKIIEDAKSEAQQQGAKMIAQARASIESEKKAAIAELKNQVANLSLDIAEKVVRTELEDKKKQLQHVETMLKDVTLN